MEIEQPIKQNSLWKEFIIQAKQLKSDFTFVEDEWSWIPEHNHL